MSTTQAFTANEQIFSAAPVTEEENQAQPDVGKKAEGPARPRPLFYLGLGFLIPVVIGLIGYIVIKVWPFGDGTVLIIDSLHQYLPFYTAFHDKLVNGESLFYDFSGGFGYDFWGTYAYYLASPFNFLIRFVPRANVGDFMDYMILFKLGCCGGIFSWYLNRRRPEEHFMPLVFGTMFAMGNFLIGYYFNLMWLDSIAVLPLIMYGIERIVEGKSGRVYGLSLFYGLWCNYYIGFMLCIFSCLYLIVTFVSGSAQTVKSFFKKIGVFAVYSLLAGCMAGMVLLPAYLSLTSSESMLNNTFPKTIKLYTSFISLFTAHFAAEHPINISDTQVGFNAYCGVIALMLILCYALDSQIALRKRLAHIAFLALMLLSVNVNVLNYIWHGFHQQNGLPNRFAFIYIVVLLVCCFDVFYDLCDMPLWKLLLAGSVPLVLSIWCIATGLCDDEAYGIWNWLTPVFLAFYLTVIIILRMTQARRIFYYAAVGGLMLAEAAGHGIYGYIYNENVTRSIYLEDQASYQNMVVAKRGDDGFFRTEFDSQRMRNVSIFAGANSIVLFNSTMPESVTAFCDHLGIEARTNKTGYLGVTKLLNDVFGIRYLLSSYGKGDQLYQFTQIDDDGNLKLYENENALSIGFVVNSDILDWDTQSGGSPIDLQNDFVNLATGMDDLYILDRTIDAQSGQSEGVKVPDNKQVYLYLPERVSQIYLDTPEYSRTYNTYTDHLYVVNSMGDQNIAQFTITKNGGGSQQVYVFTCPNETYQQVHDYLARSQLTDVKVTGRSLSGNVDSFEDGELLLTVTYSDNWKCYLNGDEVKADEIGGCLTGLKISEGKNSILMVYTPAGFREGTMLTLLSALAFAALWVIDALRARKRQKDTDNI